MIELDGAERSGSGTIARTGMALQRCVGSTQPISCSHMSRAGSAKVIDRAAGLD
jgi:hypothetical protein